MRNQLLSILVLGTAIAIGSAGCNRRAVPGPNPKVTKANFDQIKTGMSMKEVQAILGNPWKITPDDSENPLRLKNVQVSAIYEQDH